ncbi:MAG: exodeoxyribonuclease VII large subunit [Pseudohongiellaceae bacterium]
MATSFTPRSHTNSNSSSPDVLSVSSLNKLAKSLLETNFPTVVVEGEISNFAKPASGHWYLSLKDSSAQIRCAMFANKNRFIRFQPENGQQIVVRGKLSLYEGRGDYQLIIESMEPAGDGALQRAFEKLKTQLQREGLFETTHKKDIGEKFRHIGLVTSPTGAAVRDIITVFRRRFPAIRLTVFPVAVQGSNSPRELVKAIELANRLQEKLGIDALLLSRGGGSLEDLQAFNDESVARAIFASELPVTSAVGHEIDFTIADFVADLRAPTPSAAAEIMSPSQLEMLMLIRGYTQQLLQSIEAKLLNLGQGVDWLSRQLKRPDRRLSEHSKELKQMTARLSRNMDSRLNERKQLLQHYQHRLKANSLQRMVGRIREVAQAQRRRLDQRMSAILKESQAHLGTLSRSLNGVSPLNTLARGYSITFDESNKVVQSVVDVAVGDELNSQVNGGYIRSTVTSIEPPHPPAGKSDLPER